MNNFVLKGDICYCVDKDTLKTVDNGYCVCIDSLCQGVFKELPEIHKNLPLYDYTGKLIIPGLIDLHTHAPQFSFRGLNMDCELIDWLNKNAFIEEAKFSDLNYADKAYSIFADSMKTSATTRACIFSTLHKDATKIMMDKMENTGLVSFVGKVNMDRNSPDILCEESADISIKNTENWLANTINRYKNTYPILTPRFIPTCSNELMRNLKKLQLKYNLPIQSHLSENTDEIKWVSELCPDSKSYGDAYNSFGLFGSDVKTVMAHCVHSSDSEIELMKENEVFIAHCPASNTNLSSGIAPVRRYLDKGLKMGLGSDVAGGHSISIFRAISDTIQMSKLYRKLINKNSVPINFSQAFYLATIGGGEFFGKVGTFEKDYEFDAVVIDDSVFPHPQELSVKERLERCVYLNADITGIKAKFVKGKKII